MVTNISGASSPSKTCPGGSLKERERVQTKEIVFTPTPFFSRQNRKGRERCDDDDDRDYFEEGRRRAEERARQRAAEASSPVPRDQPRGSIVSVANPERREEAPTVAPPEGGTVSAGQVPLAQQVAEAEALAARYEAALRRIRLTKEALREEMAADQEEMLISDV